MNLIFESKDQGSKLMDKFLTDREREILATELILADRERYILLKKNPRKFHNFINYIYHINDNIYMIKNLNKFQFDYLLCRVHGGCMDEKDIEKHINDYQFNGECMITMEQFEIKSTRKHKTEIIGKNIVEQYGNKLCYLKPAPVDYMKNALPPRSIILGRFPGDKKRSIK